jgi:hypothetical protein
MVANPFIPSKLVGRQTELDRVRHVLASDGDLLIAGVPGSGRRTLVRYAAQLVGARVIEIDCLRAIDSHRFLNLLVEGILSTFSTSADLVLVQRWSTRQPIVLEQAADGKARLVWHLSGTDEWTVFQSLLALPQCLGEWLNCRVVIVFQNFPHLRSWDRAQKWESYLRLEIQRQSQVSYALIATVVENWVQASEMAIVLLGPLRREDLEPWVVEILAGQGLGLDSQALELFWEYVQGNFGDAIALLRRLWLDYQATQNLGLALGDRKPDYLSPNFLPTPISIADDSSAMPTKIQNPKSAIFPIQAHQIHRSTFALVEDLALTFESLLLLLPSSQVRVLESLALDPTDSPHSREYIQKHHLSRGGGLQGALASLQQKGLVYGPEHGYRITMPLLAFWLKYRLG